MDPNEDHRTPPEQPEQTALSLRDCPGDEMLLAYLAMALGGAERESVTAHLSACDGCLEALALMQRRLDIADELSVPVPVALAERAALAALQPSPESATQVHRSVAPSVRWTTRVAEVLRQGLRLPVLIPSSVAAGVLLVVAAQHFLTAEPPRTMMRSIEAPQPGRVTVTQAAVRARPDPRAEVVGQLVRGEPVDVAARERDWCQVTRLNGLTGWIECKALQ